LHISFYRLSTERDPPVNLYQSHRQRYHSYAMSNPPLKRSFSEEAGSAEALTRSLNQAFYITSYQSNITRYAGISYILLYTARLPNTV